MNEETNENIDVGVPTNGNVENAFSDLVSQYFENDGATATNVQQINTTTLDWDNVTNGQLYTNLAQGSVQNQDTTYTEVTAGNIQNGNTQYQGETADSVQNDTTIYQNITAETITTGTTQEGTGILYTNLDTTGSTDTTEGTVGETTTEAGQVTGYGAVYNDIEGIGTITPTDTETTVTTTVDLGGTRVAQTVGTGVNTINTDTVTNTVGTATTGVGTTEFKLTQANLPAKIGFWTKVRNFFMPEARINYSLQQPTTNTSLWNKVQSFFSFGKNK